MLNKLSIPLPKKAFFLYVNGDTLLKIIEKLY